MKLYLIESANTPIIDHVSEDWGGCTYQCIQAQDNAELYKICAQFYDDTDYQNIVPIQDINIINSIRGSLPYDETEEVLSDIISNLLEMLEREEQQHEEVRQKYDDLLLHTEKFTKECERF